MYLTRQRVAELALLSICVFWGGSFVTVKDALSRSSPMVFTALRFALAALFLLVLYRWGLHKEHIPGGVLCGTLLFLGYSLQTAGLRLTTASRSAFLTALSIPLTPFCQCLVFWRRPRLADVAGAVLACVGTFLLTRPSTSVGGSGRAAPFNTGDLLTVLSAVGFALHMVCLNYFSGDDTSPDAFRTISVVQLAIVALFSGMLCNVVEHASLRPTPMYWAELIVVALLATAIAFAVFSWAQKHTTATRTAIICSSGALPLPRSSSSRLTRCSFPEALFAAVTAYLVSGEVMSATNICGAVLIVAGILAGELNSLPLPAGLRKWLGSVPPEPSDTEGQPSELKDVESIPLVAANQNKPE